MFMIDNDKKLNCIYYFSFGRFLLIIFVIYMCNCIVILKYLMYIENYCYIINFSVKD